MMEGEDIQIRKKIALGKGCFLLRKYLESSLESLPTVSSVTWA